MTIRAHFIKSGKGTLYTLPIEYAPRVGDELRFTGEKFYKVLRLVWVYDEHGPHTRLNIEITEV